MSWSIRACVVTICFFRVLDTTQGDWAAPEYALDLDLPARERWGHIALDLVHKHGWECTYKYVVSLVIHVNIVVSPLYCVYFLCILK